MSPRDRDGGGGEVVDLWAMAADLERHFAGYKQRLADRTIHATPDDADADAIGGVNDVVGGGEEEEEEEVRGRMYEAYTRRRDERLREGWRARMERKEAEVMALWARLERRAGGGGDTADGGGGAAGEKAGDDEGEKRRSSDAAAPAGRISGKKHARTRSFSSPTTKTAHRDAVARRALSHEPPPPPPPTSEPPPAAAAGSRRVTPVTGVRGSTSAEKRRVFSAQRTSAARDQRGSSAKCGKNPKPKPPSILSNICSAEATPPVQSCCSSEQNTTIHGETEKDSSLQAPFAAVSPDSDRGEIMAVGSGEDDKTKDFEEHNSEEAMVSRLANGDNNITSESETEPSYVYVVKKDIVVVDDDDAMARRSEALDSPPNCEDATSPESRAGAVAESATTIAGEAPARESSDESPSSSFSAASAATSCISRAPSIERLLVEDAALLRKKRQEVVAAEKRAVTPKTPTAAMATTSTPPARVSGGGGGAARSPREAAVRGFKRFLSFGKKNRSGGGREVTVIDCTSPSVPSVADDDSGSGGGWQWTDTIKPRMASSDTASDDMDHGHVVSSSPQACSLQSLVAASPAKSELNEIDPHEKSPKAHRSFFSFRSFNCGRS
uniref:Uncharacterized protein n=1 Tax=Leersia perrieri TaxID=77586 RepID=A0A0D9VLV1_9ORYZ